MVHVLQNQAVFVIGLLPICVPVKERVGGYKKITTKEGGSYKENIDNSG